MSADRADSEHRHEVDEIVRALRGFGVLTEPRLAELVNAECWPQHTFKAAVRSAVASGRVTRLGDGLYELSERERSGG